MPTQGVVYHLTRMKTAPFSLVIPYSADSRASTNYLTLNTTYSSFSQIAPCLMYNVHDEAFMEHFFVRFTHATWSPLGKLKFSRPSDTYQGPDFRLEANMRIETFAESFRICTKF